MLKEIFEKYKGHYASLLNLDAVETNPLQILEDIIIDLEKASAFEEEMATVIKEAIKYNLPTCPFCNNDLRQQWDCKNCEIDHIDGHCHRDGRHENDCAGILVLEKYYGNQCPDAENCPYEDGCQRLEK